MSEPPASSVSPTGFHWRDGDALTTWLDALPPPGEDTGTRALLCVHADPLPVEVLGELCRRFPHEVRVEFASLTPSPDTVACLRALGFSTVERCHDDSAISSWIFSLYDYKSSPAWLNAKYWANPERFGLDVGIDGDEEFDHDSDYVTEPHVRYDSDPGYAGEDDFGSDSDDDTEER